MHFAELVGGESAVPLIKKCAIFCLNSGAAAAELDSLHRSKNVVMVGETLQSHEYYWLQAMHMAKLFFFIYTVWTMGIKDGGVVSI